MLYMGNAEVEFYLFQLAYSNRGKQSDTKLSLMSPNVVSLSFLHIVAVNVHLNCDCLYVICLW